MSYSIPDYNEKKGMAESRSPSVNKRVYTWEEIGLMMHHLGDRLELTGHISDYIVGVTRGGLVPAVALSNRFKKPLVVIDPFEFKVEDLPSGHLLIVDDVFDTGKVLKEIEGKIIKERIYTLAALVSKPWAPKGSNIVTVCETTDWICFPWEV